MEQFTCANIFAGLHHPSSTGEKIKKTGNDKRQIFVESKNKQSTNIPSTYFKLDIHITLSQKKHHALQRVYIRR